MHQDTKRRKATVLKSGLVGLLVSGVYLAAWEVLVERATCESTAMFGCSGPAVLLILVGVPLTYVVWSLGLTWAGHALPWLAPLIVFGFLVVVVPLTGSIGVPKASWVIVVAVLSAGLARWTQSWRQQP